jgi:hypothetical protein
MLSGNLSGKAVQNHDENSVHDVCYPDRDLNRSSIASELGTLALYQNTRQDSVQ